MNRLVFALIVLLMALVSLGCCRKPSDDDGTRPQLRELPKLELRDDTADLHITWIDAKGDFHVVHKPADVPVEGRDAVRVYVAGREEGTGDLLYVADLRTKLADGTYPVQTLARSEWEAVAERRRPTSMVAASPSAGQDGGGAGQAPTAAPVRSRVAVIVYGAEWCEACKDAMAYLRRKGVEAVEKDIDDDPGARAEMKKKLARAGLPDRGSIPVIDVRGKILTGFSPREIDRALAEAVRGEEL
ncbi:MAG TPA: glutaredoxin domain-containing protein [Polyangiaceae bacterium]|nr:glutaredoxin domain-containing protein [Polyangiaceae bacterium]